MQKGLVNATILIKDIGLLISAAFFNGLKVVTLTKDQAFFINNESRIGLVVYIGSKARSTKYDKVQNSAFSVAIDTTKNLPVYADIWQEVSLSEKDAMIINAQLISGVKKSVYDTYSNLETPLILELQDLIFAHKIKLYD